MSFAGDASIALPMRAARSSRVLLFRFSMAASGPCHRASLARPAARAARPFERPSRRDTARNACIAPSARTAPVRRPGAAAPAVAHDATDVADSLALCAVAQRLLSQHRKTLLLPLQHPRIQPMTTKSCARRLAACAALAACATGTALAQTAAAPATPATPEHTLTANVGLYSEYIFRGIAQTGGKPAVQGGFDYAHSSGFYAGTWASNISWLEDFGAYNRSSVEWDVYGGYKSNFPGSDFFYDVGAYGYLYPGSRNPGVADADTWELYGALGWEWASVKFSYSLTDYFGARPDASQRKTDGTWYIDASATYPIGETGFAILAHVGHLDVRHDGSDSDL